MSWAAMDSVYELDIDDALAKFILVTMFVKAKRRIDNLQVDGFGSVNCSP